MSLGKCMCIRYKSTKYVYVKFLSIYNDKTFVRLKGNPTETLKGDEGLEEPDDFKMSTISESPVLLTIFTYLPFMCVRKFR